MRGLRIAPASLGRDHHLRPYRVVQGYVAHPRRIARVYTDRQRSAIEAPLTSDLCGPQPIMAPLTPRLRILSGKANFQVYREQQPTTLSQLPLPLLNPIQLSAPPVFCCIPVPNLGYLAPSCPAGVSSLITVRPLPWCYRSKERQTCCLLTLEFLHLVTCHPLTRCPDHCLPFLIPFTKRTP